MDSKPAAKVVERPIEAATAQTVSGELPFLVTHWLAGFKTAAGLSGQQAAAAETVQRAANDLAQAFSVLGVFGSAVRGWLCFYVLFG